MVKKLTIFLLIATAAVAAETKLYYDYPESSTLPTTARILFYNNSGVKDFVITGDKLGKPFRDYTGSHKRVATDPHTANMTITGSVTTPLVQGSTALQLKSNPSANGRITFGNSAYDEGYQRLGVGTVNPDRTVQTVGTAAFGNASSASAYGRTEFRTDGTLRFKRDATVFDDVVVPLLNIKAPAANPPTYVTYKGTEVPSFSASATNVLYFNIQLPHKRKEGTNIGCHLHVAYPTNGVGNSHWQFTYSWANYTGTFPAETTLTQTFASPATTDYHDIHAFTALAGTAKNLSSVILGSLSRLGANAADTYAGAIYATSFDCHVEIDSAGSDTEYAKSP